MPRLAPLVTQAHVLVFLALSTLCTAEKGCSGAEKFSSGAEKSCSGSPTVSITFSYTWTAANETSPDQYPSTAHFSPLVCARSAGATLFVPGAIATPGFTMIAQMGATMTLKEELEKLADAHKEAPGPAPGTSVFMT